MDGWMVKLLKREKATEVGLGEDLSVGEVALGRRGNGDEQEEEDEDGLEEEK